MFRSCLVAASIFAAGCSSSDLEEALYGEENLAPVITVNAQPAGDLEAGDTGVIRISVQDPNGQNVTINWTQTDGPTLNYDIDEDNRGVSFTVPAVEEDDTAVFSVTANDGTFDTTRVVNVVINANDKPLFTANLTAAARLSGETFSLQAPTATDDEGDALKYRWSVFDGVSVQIVENEDTGLATITLPETTENQLTVLQVAVTDIVNGSERAEPDTRSVNIMIGANSNAVINDTIADIVIESGGEFTINAPDTEDFEGDTITRDWRIVSGSGVSIISEEDGTAHFTASETTEDLNSVVRFSVKDDLHSEEVFQDVLVTVNANDPPEIIAAELSPIVIGAGEIRTIAAPTVIDDEGDDITYDWTLVSGVGQTIDFDPNTGELFLKGDDFENDTQFQLRLRVRDELHPDADSAQTTLTVTANSAPTVNVTFDANGQREYTADGGELVTVTADVLDTDTPDTEVELSWESIGEADISFVVRDDESTIEITAPNEEEGGRGVIQATVTDGTSSSSQTVVLNYNRNLPPVIGTMPVGEVVQPDQEYFLTPPAGTEDPEGQDLIYEWSQTFGPSVTLIPTNDDSVFSFVAPNLADDSYITFTLTVEDSLGQTATKTQRLQVAGNGSPVIAPAGFDNVDGGITFRVFTTVTDPEGDAVTITWEQVLASGEDDIGFDTVTSNPAAIDIETPKKDEPFTLTFRVTADDGINDPISSTIEVDVLAFDFQQSLVDAMATPCVAYTTDFAYSEPDTSSEDFTPDYLCTYENQNDAQVLLQVNGTPSLALETNADSFVAMPVNGEFTNEEAAAGNNPITATLFAYVTSDETATADTAEELDAFNVPMVVRQRIQYSFQPRHETHGTTYNTGSVPDYDAEDKTDEFLLIWAPDISTASVVCDAYPENSDGVVDRSTPIRTFTLVKNEINTESAEFAWDQSDSKHFRQGDHAVDCYVGDVSTATNQRQRLVGAMRIRALSTGCTTTFTTTRGSTSCVERPVY